MNVFPENAVRAQEAPAGDELERLVARFAGGRALTPETTFDELGLTSLDRVELVTALEDHARKSLSEAAVSGVRTIGDLRRIVAGEAVVEQTPNAAAYPHWARARPLRVLRNISQATWVLPPTRVYMPLTVEGRHHLNDLKGPVIFAPNHQSHGDVMAVLRALPGRWRRRVAVPIWKEYFDAHFFPERYPVGERVVTSTVYGLLALFLHAFPLPQTEPTVREALRYIGDLVTDGFSIVIFPEGQRTERGEINRFQPGVGLLASRLRLPVVPIRLEGVHHVLHRRWKWPKRGLVRVTFGTPLTLEGDDYRALTRRVEDAVRNLGSPVVIDPE